MPWDDQTTRSAVRHLRRRDPILRDVIQQVGPFAMKLERNRFRALLRSIIAQQISGSAARSIWKRLLQAVQLGPPTAEKIAALSTDDLRAAGISPQKASYIHDLAARTSDGRLRLARLSRLADEDVIAELVQVKGIGEWTAHMFLMFSLGRPDVLAHGDLGVRTAIRELYALPELPDRETTRSIAEPWRPFSTVACWYCWRSSDLRRTAGNG
jgi:DNA-3-methyladenine glycosylase II